MCRNASLCLMVLAVLSAGCGVPAEIPGGTAGFLDVNGQPLPDVLVTVYAGTPSATDPLGIGVTDAEGRFELRTREPVAPLTLDPGDYRFTVESIGEIYLVWPPKYADPSKTPLARFVSSSSEELHISVPEPRMSEFR